MDVSRLNVEVSELKEKVSKLEENVDVLQERMCKVEDRLQRIELTQENNMLPRLQNIEACYTTTYDRYKDSVDDYEAMKTDPDIQKKVVAEHSDKLQKIS